MTCDLFLQCGPDARGGDRSPFIVMPGKHCQSAHVVALPQATQRGIRAHGVRAGFTSGSHVTWLRDNETSGKRFAKPDDGVCGGLTHSGLTAGLTLSLCPGDTACHAHAGNVCVQMQESVPHGLRCWEGPESDVLCSSVRGPHATSLARCKHTQHVRAHTHTPRTCTRAQTYTTCTCTHTTRAHTYTHMHTHQAYAHAYTHCFTACRSTAWMCSPGFPVSHHQSDRQ